MERTGIELYGTYHLGQFISLAPDCDGHCLMVMCPCVSLSDPEWWVHIVITYARCPVACVGAHD